MSEPNTFEDERKVIEKAFASAWGATTKVRFENQAWAEPKDDKTWVALSIVTTDGVQISLQERALHRYGGTVIVQVFQKERTGTSDANKLAGKAAEVFRGRTLCEDDSGLLRFRTPSKLTVGPNNGWYQINVRCPYFRDAHHTRPTS